jgi:hypothetical protein
MFAQASGASQDLSYRDPRFDAVLSALAEVPMGSEFRSQAEALANRIRQARARANASDAESKEAIDRALAQPAFESQGKMTGTFPSAQPPRPPGAPVPASPPTSFSGPRADSSQNAAAAARALQRSLPAEDQEPPEEEVGSNAASASEESDEPGKPPPPATAAPAKPPSPPPTPPGQIFGLPGPAGKAMGTRP